MRSAVAATTVVLVLFTALVAVPFLTDKRDYPASIPQASPLYFTSVVPVAPRSQACFRDAVIEEHSEEARFRVGTVRRAGAPLRMSILGPGYSFAARIQGGYQDNELLAVPVDPPTRPTPVRVCIRNDGRTRMDLYAAGDSTRSRSHVELDGRRLERAIQFSFWERQPRSIAERFPETIERMTVFRPGWVGEWLLWPLAALLVAGMPAVAVWGLWRSFRE